MRRWNVTLSTIMELDHDRAPEWYDFLASAIELVPALVEPYCDCCGKPREIGDSVFYGNCGHS